MKLYQLVAKGPSANFNDQSRFYSQRVFKTKEEAEDYKPAFEKKVVGGGLFDLASVSEFKIVELELLDE